MKRNEPFNVLRNPNSWDKCPRAEAIVLTVAGFTSAGAATAALGAFAYNAAILAVSAGLSLVTSWAVAALTPAPPTPKQSLLVNTRDAAAPQEQVYGEVRKGGVTTYYESTRGGSVLYQIIVLAAHEIESVEDIYVNDKVVTLSEDGYDSGARTGAGWVLDEEFTDDGNEHEIRIFYHKGDQTSITDTFDNSSVESLDSVFFNTGSADEDSQNFGGAGQPSKESFVGNGMAYLFIRFSFNASVFQQGIPLITARVKGKKIYDPRETGHSATDPSTWEYSDNAALCIRDFLSQPAGLNDSEIDDAVIQVAANTSDELVPLAGGGSEPRYTINGVVRSNQSYGDVLQEMTTACAGTLFWGGGKWKLTVGEYNAPTKTLTLDDLRSGISLSTRNNLRDQFNRVQGVFTDASNGFIPVDYPPIVSEGPGSFTEQDGGVPQALDLDLPFTTSSSAAQRLAKMTLFRGREQMVFSADFGLNAFDIEVGEIISLDMDRYGWTGKDFEVIGWNFNVNGEAGDLRISMVLRETSESAFDWDAEESEIISNDTNLPDIRANLGISNFTVSGGGRTQSDGTFVSTAILQWDEAVNAFVNQYEVQWKPVADSAYSATFTTNNSIELSPLIDGIEYDFRVRSITSLGIRGPFTSVTFTGGGDVTAPGPVTGLSAVGAYQVITLNYTPPTDADWNVVNIYESLDNVFANSSIIGTSASDVFYRLNLPNDVTRYYWVETVDLSGNKGSIVGPVSATTQLIEENDFSQSLQDTLDQAGVNAVNTLPASGDFDGQIVLLLSDFTLYRWDEAAGQWSDTLFTAVADNSVTTQSLVANAVITSKLAAGAVTADKMSVNQLTAVAAQIGTFQSAASGARLKISDDVIEVYDSSGNIRVKLGNLA